MNITLWRLTFIGVFLLAAAVICCGCPEQAAEQVAVDAAAVDSTPVATSSSPADEKQRFSNDSVYPIPRSDRDYQEIHASAAQAWFLIETGYYIINDKYTSASRLMSSDDPAERERGSQLRNAVNAEIDSSIFVVNDSIEALFLEAIEVEPDNPLNMAAYAYYLKPRKREIEPGTFVDAESEALEMMDRAIELWPDEASFYLLKVNILVDTHQCHDWLRGQLAQHLVISKRLEMVRTLCHQAERYYPDNHYINYRLALLLVRFTPPDQFHTIRDEVLSELHKGNSKPDGYFNFPPPLQPYPATVERVRLSGNEQKAKYIDQWNFFGHYDTRSVSMLVDGVVSSVSWPRDKQDTADLMYFLYQLGRTRPFDRSMFSLQLKVLSPQLAAQEKGSEEALKLAEALRFLDQQYREVADDLHGQRLIIDATRLDVRGINDIEIGSTHMKNLKAIVQPSQGSYLKRAAEILELEYPLPDNPKLW